MSTFPIVPIPDPNDDGFEKPVCWECYGSRRVKEIDWSGEIEYVPCDCQRKEKDG